MIFFSAFLVAVSQYHHFTFGSGSDSDSDGAVDDDRSENGQLKEPFDVVVDPRGDLFVTDLGNHRIQKFTSDGKFLSTFGSQGSALGQFYGPRGMAFDKQGNLYVCDAGNSRVQVFSPTGQFIRIIGSKGFDNGQFSYPYGVAIDKQGNVIVSYYANIQVFDSNGNFIRTIGSKGSGDNHDNGLTGVTIDDQTGNILVCDGENHSVKEFTLEGKFVTKFHQIGDLPLTWPVGIAIDPQTRDIIVSDHGHNINGDDLVIRFSRDGKQLIRIFGIPETVCQFERPYGVAVDQQGNVFIVDSNYNRVHRFVLRRKKWTTQAHKHFNSSTQTEIKTVLKMALKSINDDGVTMRAHYPQAQFHTLPTEVLHLVFQFIATEND